jgi:hypothetical protein
MSSIFTAVVTFFQEKNWDYDVVTSDSILSTEVAGENGSWKCLILIEEEAQYLCFYSILPFNVNPNRKEFLAEFLMRANFGMKIGNFEMDFEDGEIRYKTSLNLGHIDINSAIIERLIYSNLSMMDIYLPGIMKVMYADISPQEAIVEVEQ